MSETHPGFESLLEPTLGKGSGATAIYSVRAGFFVAFFGGPFAILIFSALNSRRLERLGRDAWIYGMLGLVAVAFVVALTPIAVSSPPEWLAAAVGWLGEGSRAVRNASRILALLFFGAVFLLHRAFHKAAQLQGLDAPSPWLPGLGAVLAGGVLSMAIVAAVLGATGV